MIPPCTFVSLFSCFPYTSTTGIPLLCRIAFSPPPVSDQRQSLVEILRQSVHVSIDGVDAQLFQCIESALQTENAQEVDRSVFEATAGSILHRMKRSRVHGTN